jgi:hypothetical protein
VSNCHIHSQNGGDNPDALHLPNKNKQFYV